MSSFEPLFLPEAERERLCRSLLAEFGVTNVKVTTEGEMIHSCCLPFKQHKNGDRSPSASLNYKKLTYNCLGCGNSGGLLWFIGVCRGETGGVAREWLKEQTGQGPDGYSVSALLQVLDALYAAGENKPATTPIPVMSEQVLKPWMLIHPYLTDPPNWVDGRNLGGRGVPEQNVVDLKVGYGTFEVKVSRYESVQSRRIVFPHFWEGRLTGWQTRRLTKDGTSKYLSTPDFPRDQTIYNYDRKRKTVVVVESPFSVLRHAHHQPMEATFGAKVTERQVRMLAIHPRVVLWMDNDTAGWNAVGGIDEVRRGRTYHTPGAAEKLVKYSDVYVVDSPWAADPADLPDEEVDRLVEAAVPYSFWAKPKELLAWEPVPA